MNMIEELATFSPDEVSDFMKSVGYAEFSKELGRLIALNDVKLAELELVKAHNGKLQSDVGYLASKVIELGGTI